MNYSYVNTNGPAVSLTDPNVDYSEVVNDLSKAFADQSVKQRTGRGDQVFSYIEPHTVIRRLNDATHGAWSFGLDAYHIDSASGVALAIGWLSIPGLGTRSDIGTCRIDADKGGEEQYKAAISDLLKRCARHFGVGLELYGPDLEAGEVDTRPQNQSRPSSNGGGKSNDPLTDPQRKKIYAMCKNLDIDFDTDLKDAVAIRYNATMDTLDKSSASSLIELLTNDPESLSDVSELGKDLKMTVPVAEHWVKRMEALDADESAELLAILQGRFVTIPEGYVDKIREGLSTKAAASGNF